MDINLFRMRFPEGKGKAMTLSYDDGVYSDYKLVDILNKYGVKCTFNLNSGRFLDNIPIEPRKTRDMITADEAKELYLSGGHEIAMHTLTHGNLARLSPATIAYQVMKDRENLERITEKPVRGLAYPWGEVEDGSAALLKSMGVAYGRTTVSTESFQMPKDWLQLKTTCHHSNPKLMELLHLFQNQEISWRRDPLFFYLWGHSYEFDMNDNWAVIEEFCKEASNCLDIWFATNIQIYDYYMAWNQLIFSANGQYVENPTAIKIWIDCAGKLFCINPGETIQIV